MRQSRRTADSAACFLQVPVTTGATYYLLVTERGVTGSWTLNYSLSGSPTVPVYVNPSNAGSIPSNCTKLSWNFESNTPPPPNCTPVQNPGFGGNISVTSAINSNGWVVSPNTGNQFLACDLPLNRVFLRLEADLCKGTTYVLNYFYNNMQPPPATNQGLPLWRTQNTFYDGSSNTSIGTATSSLYAAYPSPDAWQQVNYSFTTPTTGNSNFVHVKIEFRSDQLWSGNGNAPLSGSDLALDDITITTQSQQPVLTANPVQVCANQLNGVQLSAQLNCVASACPGCFDGTATWYLFPNSIGAGTSTVSSNTTTFSTTVNITNPQAWYYVSYA